MGFGKLSCHLCIKLDFCFENSRNNFHNLSAKKAVFPKEKMRGLSE